MTNIVIVSEPPRQWMWMCANESPTLQNVVQWSATTNDLISMLIIRAHFPAYKFAYILSLPPWRWWLLPPHPSLQIFPIVNTWPFVFFLLLAKLGTTAKMIYSIAENQTCQIEQQQLPTRRCFYKIPSQEISILKLLKILEKIFEEGSYNVEMRQNIYYVYANSNRTWTRFDRWGKRVIRCILKYLLVGMDQDEDSWWVVRHVPWVDKGLNT